MPAEQVFRGQGGTGLRFLTRFSSHNLGNDAGSDSKSKGKDNGANNSDNDGNSNGSNGANNSNNGSNSNGPNGSPHPPIASTSTASSPSFSNGPSPPSFPCFLPCVPDNDPRVVYSASWSLSPQGFYQTSHQTDVVGSTLSFSFNGTGITVFGSIPASDATHAPPTAAYSIDAAPPMITTEPMATDIVFNQQLFSASGLSDGLHTLAINVTDVQSASPFMIDYFLLKSASATSAIASQNALNAGSANSSSRATVRILAGVLGSVIFVLLCAIALFILTIRRRRRRALRSKDMQSSLFTTPESIIICSREPSSHYPAASNSWFSKTRSVGGKSWISNLEGGTTFEKSRS